MWRRSGLNAQRERRRYWERRTGGAAREFARGARHPEIAPYQSPPGWLVWGQKHDAAGGPFRDGSKNCVRTIAIFRQGIAVSVLLRGHGGGVPLTAAVYMLRPRGGLLPFTFETRHLAQCRDYRLCAEQQ